MFSAGDSAGDRTDLLLVRSGVDPSFYFHVYWVFIYLLIYLLALLQHPLYACIAFYVAYLLLSYTGWVVVL